MDIQVMIVELREERACLDEALMGLERLAQKQRPRRGRPPKWLKPMVIAFEVARQRASARRQKFLQLNLFVAQFHSHGMQSHAEDTVEMFVRFTGHLRLTDALEATRIGAALTHSLRSGAVEMV